MSTIPLTILRPLAFPARCSALIRLCDGRVLGFDKEAVTHAPCSQWDAPLPANPADVSTQQEQSIA